MLPMNNDYSKNNLVLGGTLFLQEPLKLSLRLYGIWQMQIDISKLFNVNRSIVTRYLQNIFAKGEGLKKQFVQNLHKPMMTWKQTNINLGQTILYVTNKLQKDTTVLQEALHREATCAKFAHVGIASLLFKLLRR